MSERILIRCDGGDALGAGHVSRCLPIAEALRDRGADVAFAGTFSGVAAWMLEQHDAQVIPPASGPCGVDASQADAALVDLYLPRGEAEVCSLAAMIPVATLGEATRCTRAGIWIDYHAGAAPGVDGRRLGGAAFIPVDPRFTLARRPRSEIRRILVMTGGSKLFTDVGARMAEVASEAFPAADLLAPKSVAEVAAGRVVPLVSPFDLADLAAEIDLAVVSAGMTTYELAAAGIPVVAVALVENQRVVLDGCRASGIAVAVDGIDRDPTEDIRLALRSLTGQTTREALARAAMLMIDGRGAERIATALLSAWTGPGTTGTGR